MKFTLTVSAAVLAAVLLPFAVHAQVPVTATGSTLTDLPSLFAYVLNFINQWIVPIVFAIAFVAFLIGIYIYFIQGGGNSESVAKGRQFLIWSLIGFFVMFSVWGLVNLLVGTLGFNNQSNPGIPTFTNTSAGSTVNTGTGLEENGNPISTGGCPVGYMLSGGQCVGTGSNGTTAGGQYCSDGTTSASGTSCIQCAGIGTTANAQTCATAQQNAGLNSSGQTTSGGCPAGYTDTNNQCISNGTTGNTVGGQYCSDGTTSAPGTSCVQCAGIGTTANTQTCATAQQNAGLNSSGQTTSGSCPAGYTETNGQCISNGTNGNTIGGQYCSDGTTSAPGTSCVQCAGIGPTANAQTCATDQQNAGLDSNGNIVNSGGSSSQTCTDDTQGTCSPCYCNDSNGDGGTYYFGTSDSNQDCSLDCSFGD